MKPDSGHLETIISNRCDSFNSIEAERFIGLQLNNNKFDELIDDY